MNIIVAKGAGFCFGVNRAANIVMDEAKKGTKVQTYGPLIHNPEYIQRLSEIGVTSANSPEEIESKTIVTRTHGITRELEIELAKKNLTVVDATCPFVKKVQKLAEDYTKRGYEVIILGEENHPEIISVKSYAPLAHVVNSTDDVPPLDKNNNILFISQTTQSTDKYHKIGSFLLKTYPNVETINTICGATENNQNEVSEMAKEVDLMIIIGGKESSNTSRLREVAEKFVKTHHILNARELQKEWFANVGTVGIAAGASTPDFSIEEVKKYIEKFNDDDDK